MYIARSASVNTGSVTDVLDCKARRLCQVGVATRFIGRTSTREEKPVGDYGVDSRIVAPIMNASRAISFGSLVSTPSKVR